MGLITKKIIALKNNKYSTQQESIKKIERTVDGRLISIRKKLKKENRKENMQMRIAIAGTLVFSLGVIYIITVAL